MCDTKHNKLSTLSSRIELEAYNLSHDEVTGDAKQLLHETLAVLAVYDVTVYKHEGLTKIKNGAGDSRKLTFKERVALFLLNGKTSITV